MKHLFVPRIKMCEPIRRKTDVEELSTETMLFSASWKFAREFGGPVTQDVLDHLYCREEIEEQVRSEALDPDLERWIVIDTRVHMLMKGMYPAIPGWHCDGLPRHDKMSQPDLKAVRSDILHYTCVLSTSPPGVSQTEFVSEPKTLDIDPERVWGSADDAMRRWEPGDLVQRDGEVFRFDQQTLHRVTPCVDPGWRFFLRLSLYHRRPQNRIRKQVQVYTTRGGW